jgi:RNA polymerase sigma-70 factor, ECF subfamily
LMSMPVETDEKAAAAVATVTDEEAIARVRRGDRDAYRILVVRYQDVLYRHALAMTGDGDVASDVVQSTFVNAYRRLAELRNASSFGGWAWRMCSNLCRDHLKSVRRRDVPLDATPQEALAAAELADAPLERSQLRRALDEAMEALNEEHRTAFVLKHVEECSYDEMSRLLGASVPALKMRVHRAREALRSALEGVL